jgi:hypothetical protein
MAHIYRLTEILDVVGFNLVFMDTLPDVIANLPKYLKQAAPPVRSTPIPLVSKPAVELEKPEEDLDPEFDLASDEWQEDPDPEFDLVCGLASDEWQEDPDPEFELAFDEWQEDPDPEFDLAFVDPADPADPADPEDTCMHVTGGRTEVHASVTALRAKHQLRRRKGRRPCQRLMWRWVAAQHGFFSLVPCTEYIPPRCIAGSPVSYSSAQRGPPSLHEGLLTTLHAYS